MKKSRRNIGQFSIVAALLVSIILVTAVIITYSMIRNNTSQESPEVLTSIGEMNLAVKSILEFTVGYYGSILQVTGNWSYAQQLASSYLQSGLVNIADSHPDWNPSFKVNYQQVSTRWFAPVSYSMGNISVTYSMSGLGIEGVTYTTSSLLKVTFLNPVNSSEARFNVMQEGNEPELGLSKQNFFFYEYGYSNSTWILVNPVSNPVAFSNGTYVLQIPSGVDQSAYLIQVADPRGISVTAFYSAQSLASGTPQYSYAFTWNKNLYSSLTRDTFVVEALQNGTLRWLGQNLQQSTNGKPIPPLPVKDLYVNETIGGISREVPFQVEDWGSNYRVPLGLTSNASLFSDRQMIVFLVNHNVQTVTLWWNGQDTTKQTSYAWTNRYFKDNPNNNFLSNGLLNLTVGNFIITAKIGSTTSSAQFLRINGYNPTYGSPPAYVIYNGTVRDIVQQEAEWSGGILKSSGATANCTNVYSQIYLTFPANATYYTYAGRLIFLNSSQSRTITDLSVIQLSVSTGSQLTENGTSAGYPISSNVAGQFYNFTSLSFQTGWAHHWSEFISSGSSGAGIMFTDNTNQKLYTFDNVAGHKTGALNVSRSSRTIEFDPLDPRSQYSASFTYPLDVTWYGAVVTFNNDPTNPIYPTSGNIGLWVMVENPPEISIITANNVSITVTSSPSGSGYVEVDGNPITTPYTFTWTIGSKHALQALSPVAGPAGTQYVWTGWSDGGAQNHTYTVPSSNATIAANWRTQYLVTFNYQVSGGGSGYLPPSVTYTSLGSQYSLTANSTATVWVDSGSNYAYTNNPLAGSGASERWYASSGTSGTISSITIINPTYYNQYYLTVSSSYGSPTGQGWYNAGSSASFAVTTPASGGAGTQYVFTSWSGSGSGSYSGTSSSGSVTMNNPITETASWQTQYYLTVSSPYGTTSGQGWYNAGSSASFSISPTTVSGGRGIQYVFSGWTGSGAGSYTGSSSSYSVTMNNPITETANWQTQYQLTFAQSGLDSSATGTVVTVNGAAETYGNLPYTTAWINGGGTVSYSYNNPVTSSTTGKQFRLSSVSGSSSPITVNGPANVTGNYVVQWQVTFQQSGLSSDATGTVLTVGSNTYTYSTFPSSAIWVDNGTTYSYTSPVPASSGKQYVLTGVTGVSSPVHASGTVTGNYKTQYQLTMATNFGTTTPVAGSTWYNASATVTISATAPGAGSGEQYVWNGWTGSGTGSYTGTSNPATNAVTMNGPITETASWTHQWQVTFQQTGLGSDAAGTVLTVGTNTYTYSQLPLTGIWVNDGTAYSYNSTVSAGGSKRYVLTGVTGVSSPVHASGTITATYKTQTFGIDTNCIGFGSESSSGSSPITTSSMTAQANELIIVVVTSGHSGSSSTRTFTVTDSFGDTYKQRGSTVSSGSNAEQISVYYWNTTSHTGNFTVTVRPNNYNRNIDVLAFGITGAASFDTYSTLPKSASSTGTSTPTVSSVYTSNPNDIVLAFEGHLSSTNENASSPFQSISSLLKNANGEGCAVEYEIVTSKLNNANVQFGTQVSNWVMIVDAVQRAW